MAKSLIITEKPSVAQEFAKILGVSGRRDGYIENDTYVITWCVGHLVEMVYPEEYDVRYKRWRLEDLPFLPEEYKYHVIPSVSRQYDIVHGMLQREDIDTVYWAGDAGKEGQTIEENIRKFGGVRSGMRELRVWIDSQTEEEILRGIREAKEMSEYDNLARSGVMRTIEDYAMGINFSRVMSVRYGKLLNDAAGTKSYTAIAVGRVMTCVLGMVVIREREIRNFTETPFYRVVGGFLPEGTEIAAETGEKTPGEGGVTGADTRIPEESSTAGASVRKEAAESAGAAGSAGNEPGESAEGPAGNSPGESAEGAGITPGSIIAEWKAVPGSKYYESPLLYKENGFKKRESAKKLIGELTGQAAVVEALERSVQKKRAPLLFNLAELQAECAKRFKISPDETLAAAQELYEKKFTTYPRTDARVLSTAVAKEIGKNVSRLKGYEPVKAFVQRIMEEGTYKKISRTQYTDDSKVTDHYAIIPTGQVGNLSSLSSLQRSVYDLIVRRFLSIFYPPAEYDSVRLTVAVAGEKLSASAKALKSPGYLEIAGIPRRPGEKGDAAPENRGEGDGSSEAENAALLRYAACLKKGDGLTVCGYGIREGKTSPPKRYTSGSMVLAMENAGQLIEEEELREQIKGSGIGTSATRAEIIKKLIRIGYLHLNKKTQVLTPESLGEMIFEVVSMTVPALLNPKMTASWEKGLDGITRGTVIMEDYRKKLEAFIRKETVAMIEQDLTGAVAEKIRPFVGKGAKGIAAKHAIDAVCPACGGTMETTPFGYGCSNYKRDGSGCRFSIGQIAGRDLSEEEAVALLREGHTEVLSGFVSKSKKKFSASLCIQKDAEGKVNVGFDFSKNEPEILDGVGCPDCGDPIVHTAYGYSCLRHKNQPDACSFSIGKIAGKELNAAQVTALLTEKRTPTIRGFSSKAGKKFDACLVLEPDENGKHDVKFDFEHVEAKKIKDVSCPVCGGDIVKTPFGFGCANYVKDDPQSCRFSIGKIAEKPLTETNVKELLRDGRTSTMRGFSSKNGKKFDARVALARDEAGKVTGLKFDFTDLEAKKLKDAVCPVCGGDIVKTLFGYGCANYAKDNPKSCRFSIGKIAGVTLKETQVKELLLRGKTETIDGFVAKTGMMFSAPLKLSGGQVVFDFPERPKPVETNVSCPKCGEKLQRGQWYYECKCGFKISHTVAKTELSETVMQELLGTGRTQERVSGFVSKAGNTFDAYLSFDGEKISFGFDRPGDGGQTPGEVPADGERPPQNEAQSPEEAAGKEMPEEEGGGAGDDGQQ